MRRVLLVFIACLCVHFLCAEESIYESDQRTWHYGFTLGINAYGFAVTPSNPAQTGAQVSSFSPGFTVGIIGDLRLNKYFNLRFTPSLNFTERTILFRDDPYNSATRTEPYSTAEPLQSTFVSLPLYLKYRSVWHGRSRPYFIAGGGVDCDLQRSKDVDVYLRSYTPFIAFGVGCDIYLDFFRLAPEFKFCLGLNNSLVPLAERNDTGLTEYQQKLNNALSRLTSKAFILTFNFE